MKGNKIRVIFVCLGNICRSPLAEAIFMHKVKKAGLESEITCSSAGTAHWHIGEPPDTRTIEVAGNHGVPINHRGNQLKPADYNEFDYFIAMDRDNYRDIRMILKNMKDGPSVHMMREFDNKKSLLDVPDPYYGDMEDFENVFRILDESCDNFIEFLKEEHKLSPSR